MNAFYLFLAVLVPFVGGALNPLIPWKKRRHMLWYLEGLVTLNRFWSGCFCCIGLLRSLRL